MNKDFTIGDLVKYRIYASDEAGNKTSEVLAEGEGEIEDILSNGNLILDKEDYLIALPDECEKVMMAKWKIKMQSVLNGVLGEGHTIEFTGDKSFKVFNNQEYVLGRSTAYEIANHWQTEVKDIIHIIIDQNISNQFQKLKGDDN